MNLKSINYWSLPGGLEGSLSIESFLRSAKRHGFEAVELCIGESGELNLDSPSNRCAEIRGIAGELGLEIASVASGLYWNYSLASAEKDKRERAVRALSQMVRITSDLGAYTLLTIPGAVDIFFAPEVASVDYSFVWEHSRIGLEKVLSVATEYNVVLGIENVWNKFLLSPMEMATFIDSFHSPAIGAYVDVANVLPYGYPEQWLKILGHRVVGVHFKDFRKAVGTIEGFVDLLEGDVNWPAVMDAISSIGYHGPVVAEMIPLYKHYPEVRIANTSRAMDAILHRGSKA